MSSVHDFDFLIGTWRLQHRRLKERLANCAEWEEFESTSRAVSLMGGLGNYDDNLIHLPSGTYCGLSLRAFDPKSGTWAIWWVDARNPHTLEVPVIGAFKDGVGTFLADDTLRGRPITVRFEWSKITPNSAHWEQAFSPDGGKTWETNWVNDLTRIA